MIKVYKSKQPAKLTLRFGLGKIVNGLNFGSKWSDAMTIGIGTCYVFK